MAFLRKISSNKCFGGFQEVYSHDSTELKCEMRFGVFIPEKGRTEKCPVLYWLSGYKNTEQDFIDKSGFQRYAAVHNVIVVNPDTCPRLESNKDSAVWGSDLGFYVDATEKPWKEHYRMYSYVTKELQAVVVANFNVNDQKSICGHSMGGFGALICALKNPGMYASVSAFCLYSNPIETRFGKKLFTLYFGSDLNVWKEYDPIHLVKEYIGPHLQIMIDMGSDDDLKKGLNVESLINAAVDAKNVTVKLQTREGYDHSYHFISTYLDNHFNHHVKFLKSKL